MLFCHGSKNDIAIFAFTAYKGMFNMKLKKNQFGSRKVVGRQVKQQCWPTGHRKCADDCPRCLIGSAADDYTPR